MGIKAYNRIVSGIAVFYYQSCNWSFAMLCKQHIMPDTKADYNVEIRFNGVENFRLQKGIAGRFEIFRVSYFLFGKDAKLGFIDCAAAANS